MRDWLPSRQQVVSDVIAAILVAVGTYIGIWCWNKAQHADISKFPWQGLGSLSSWQIATIVAISVAVLCILLAARIMLQATAIPAKTAIVPPIMSGQGQQKDRSNEEPESEIQQSIAPGDFIERFGVMWGLIITPKVFTLAFRSVMEALGARPAERVEVEHIPYCPKDYTRLEYRDAAGHRALLDGDDVSGYEGSAYCPTCAQQFQLAPGYQRRVPLSKFWEQVDAEHGRD